MSRPRRVNNFLNLPLGLYTGFVLVYFVSGADFWVGATSALPIPPTQLFVVSLLPPIGFLVMGDILRRRPLARLISVFTGNSIILVAFFALVSFALVLSMHPTANWTQGGKFISLFVFDLVVFLFALMLPLLRFVRERFQLIVLLAMLTLLGSVITDVFVPGSFSDLMSRAAGFPGNANLCSVMIVMMAASALSYDSKDRKFDSLVLTVAAIGVFATLSRSGMLNLGIVIVFYTSKVFFGSKGSMKRGMMFLMVVGVLATLFVTLVPIVIQNSDMMASPRAQARVKMLFGGQFIRGEESRIRMVMTSMELINDAPMFGHGTGFSRSWHTGTHNLYLQQWVNNGLVGVLLYVLLLSASYFVFRKRKFPAGQALMIVTATGSLFSHNILDIRSFLLLFGMLTSISFLQTTLSGAAAATQTIHMPSKAQRRRTSKREVSLSELGEARPGISV